MRNFTLGIDVGGTNTKFGLVNSIGKVVYGTALSTKSFVRDKKQLIAAIITHINIILRERSMPRKNILGIGIGLPGLINTKQGIVHSLTNIPGWKNVPLKSIIEKVLGLKTFIDNDVNVITLGEWQRGAGRGFTDLVCLTLGTGVGGGLVINNNLYRGPSYAAGELGHMVLSEKGLSCNCRGNGCLETYIGNSYLLSRARKIFKNKNIILEEITSLAAKGNKKALLFWEESGVHLGNALCGVVNLLNPQCIVIGGGISNAHKYLLSSVRKTIKDRAMVVPARLVKVVKAQLGSNAGIIGASVLVKKSIEKKK